MKAEVTKRSGLAMQVCIPEDWTDEQARDFAESENPCGTQYGWHLRRQGSPLLAGKDERVLCADRNGFVHIMFDA